MRRTVVVVSVLATIVLLGLSGAALAEERVVHVAVRADSEHPGMEAFKAMDGHPGTFWHSVWRGAVTNLPHEIVVDLGEPREITGFTCLPRAHAAGKSAIKDYEVYLSDRPEAKKPLAKGVPVAKGAFVKKQGENVVKFDAPVKGRYFRLRALSNITGQPTWAGIGELTLHCEGVKFVARPPSVGGNPRYPAPSEPAKNLADAVKWLEGEAHRVIRACAVKMNDGTLAFPPQIGIAYDAFWLRDYEYAVEGSIRSFSDKELTDACRRFVKSVSPEGAGVDCVRFSGQPIYKPGYGSMGRNPVLDGPPFTVSVAWHTYQRTKDKKLLGEMLDALVKTMNYMPRNPKNGLAHIKFPGERCPYGFTDKVGKSGDVLFCSLLAVQASRQLGDLLEAGQRKDEAAEWRKEAKRITESVRSVFWDGKVGLLRSATEKCNVPDIWGSAFAVWLDVASQKQALAIARYFKEHYREIVLNGQVRHTPGFMDWNGNKTKQNGGTYQFGAFWATPVGWFVYALDLVDPELADKTVIDMVNHFKMHGACEWINAEHCQLPGYTASPTLPLAGIRAMKERRAKSAGKSR